MKHLKLKQAYSMILKEFEEFKQKKKDHEQNMNERKKDNSDYNK